MREAATSESVAITQISHYSGIILLSVTLSHEQGVSLQSSTSLTGKVRIK